MCREAEVLKSWSLEIDYSRAPCLGADQKARGLWERDCLNSKPDCFMLTMLERMCLTCRFLPQGKALKNPYIIVYEMCLLLNI